MAEVHRPSADASWVAAALVRGGSVRVGEGDLAQLIRSLDLIHLDAGSVIYTPEETPRGVSIIDSGCVELSRTTRRGRCVVAVFREGDVLGDVALLQDTPPTFTARTLEPTATWFLPADDFRRLVAGHPSLAVGWLCSLAARLNRSRTRLADVVDSKLPVRVARLLISECEGGVVRLSQTTIAQMLGVQRTSVNKVLNEFERDGSVALEYRTVSVNDMARLKDVADKGPRRSPVVSSRRTTAGRTVAG